MSKRSKVSQRVQVAVRIRPRLRAVGTAADGAKAEIEELMTVTDRTVTLAGANFGVAQSLAYDDKDTDKNSHTFTFDHIVDSRDDSKHTPNAAIFEKVGRPII
eukprot:PhF_6_TR9300/c0_g1_i1/m.14714